MRFNYKDISIIIPTKDRPEKIRNLLNSLKAQSNDFGRIIIIDGGESIESVADEFKKWLPVEYYECNPPGQIRQKIMGISLIDQRTPLVCFFDDDIVLLDNSFKEMLDFWNNNKDENIAGVSFNVINAPEHKHNCIKGFIGLSSPYQGKVLKSGMNVSIVAISSDIKSEWLIGGATVWKHEILKKYAHSEINGRWAVCEDLIFSYPIGKHHSLFVCSKAMVRHEHVNDHLKKINYVYYGRTEALWRYFFVLKNKDLSQFWYFWFIFNFGLIRIVYGILRFDKRNIQMGLGGINGALLAIHSKFFGKDILQVIEKNN